MQRDTRNRRPRGQTQAMVRAAWDAGTRDTGELARLLGVSPASVTAHKHALGLPVAPPGGNNRGRGETARRVAEAYRNGITTTNALARLTGVTPSAIVAHKRRLGLPIRGETQKETDE